MTQIPLGKWEQWRSSYQGATFQRDGGPRFFNFFRLHCHKVILSAVIVNRPAHLAQGSSTTAGRHVGGPIDAFFQLFVSRQVATTPVTIVKQFQLF